MMMTMIVGLGQEWAMEVLHDCPIVLSFLFSQKTVEPGSGNDGTTGPSEHLPLSLSGS